ncbi:alpha/beta hydrolase [Tenuifilum thalassicum]|uniref:Alpha/beta hydrolase n=1 Tax=Tenuifilum thalassicum TaxID=2590900 RepID=A0A7D3XJX9_9BACT|nr:alpha/beta hydrolase [Tenuifilum thalassicum]QKG79330.1 alpha/beta hydrolase [Tenuifilum thalassicum]
MKIQRKDIHVELRPYIKPLMLINFLLSRRWGIHLMQLNSRFNRIKSIKGFVNEIRYIKGSDGCYIRVRIYKPLIQTDRLPGILFCHSGGFVVGSPEENHDAIERFLRQRPCVVVAPDYRKAPKYPFPAAFNDCYDTLTWMNEHADELKIIPNQLIVVGYSAGGGLAISITLRAVRENKIGIAFQMPIYPMIDDRQVTESSNFTGTPVWDSKTNALAWKLYLADLFKNNKEISDYAAPARCTSFKGLPPTISIVGTSEPFRDEVIEFVNRLEIDGVEVQFKQFDGCFHAFDLVAPSTNIGKDAIDFILTQFSSYYDINFPDIQARF